MLFYHTVLVHMVSNVLNNYSGTSVQYDAQSVLHKALCQQVCYMHMCKWFQNCISYVQMCLELNIAWVIVSSMTSFNYGSGEVDNRFQWVHLSLKFILKFVFDSVVLSSQSVPIWESCAQWL